MENYSNYPKELYKYTPFNKNTIRGLIHSEFWFSNPKDFNDPYDCKTELDFDFNEDELVEYLNRTNLYYTDYLKSLADPNEQIAFLSSLYRNQRSLDQLLQTIDNIYNRDQLVYSQNQINGRLQDFRDNPNKFIERLSNVAKEEVKNYRIFCLSGNKSSSTMWAHYSDNHKGICIEFNVQSDLNFFNFPLKVQYEKLYPNYNFVREWDRHEAMLHILRTKHVDWEYEEEYRVVKDFRKTEFKDGGLLKIDRSSISNIMFGLRTDKSDIELIKEINIKYYNNKITLYQAEEKSKSFDIAFQKLN